MPQENTPATPRSAEEIEAELATIVDPVEVNEDDTPDPAVVSAQRAIESEATRKGWVPKDQYNGDPSKWVDAETFVERGKKFNVNLQREVERLKKQLESFEGTKAAFVKFTEERLAAKDAELKDAIAALRIQRSQAVREGDDELAIQLEDRIDVLKDQQKEVKKLPEEIAKPEAKMDDPVLNDWIDDGNEWFREDEKLREYAVALGNEIVRNGENVVDGKLVKGRKFLNLLRERMEEEFPRRFKAKTDTTGGRKDPVAGSSSGASATRGGKTEADLPAVDRQLMKQFIAEGYTTKEKFLASYFSR